jgi:hypothetical protein
MSAYPFKLGKPEGRRRLELLEALEGSLGPVTMDEMGDRATQEDLRWLWRNELVEVVGARPLQYAVTEYGKTIIQRAPEARAKQQQKEALAS